MSLDGERELGLYGLRVALANTAIAAEEAADFCRKIDRVEPAAPWRDSLDHVWNEEHQHTEETPITTTIEKQWENVRKTLVTLMENPFFRSRSALFTGEIGYIARQGNTSDSLECCEAAIHQLIATATQELMELVMEMSHVAEIPVMPLKQRTEKSHAGVTYWPVMPRDFGSVLAMLEKFDPHHPFDIDIVRMLTQGNVYGVIAHENRRDVGCTLLEESKDDTIIRLRACAVALGERRKGIGSSMLGRIAATLYEPDSDFSSIDVTLPIDDIGTKAFFEKNYFRELELQEDEETGTTVRVMNLMK